MTHTLRRFSHIILISFGAFYFISNRGPDLTDQESQDSVYYSRRSFPRRAVCEQILKAACLYDNCLIIRRFRKSSRIVLDGRWSCQSRVTHKKDKKGVVLVAQWHVCGFGYGILTAAPSLISRCISCSWQSTAQTTKILLSWKLFETCVAYKFLYNTFIPY